MRQTRWLTVRPIKTNVRWLVLAAVLMSVPSVAGAGPVLESSNNFPHSLHLTPAYAEFGFSVDFLGYPNFDGQATVTTGPLTQVLTQPGLGPSPDTIYVYDPGTITIDMFWQDEHGAFQWGQFRAAIPEWRIHVQYEGFICEICPHTDLNPPIVLGAGSFDSHLAAALGVARQTVGGEIPFFFEKFTGAPGSTDRLAGINFGGSFTVAVPEPASIALFGVAAAGLMSRKRRLHA